HSFIGLASYDRSPMNLTGKGRPERIIGETVSAGFFQVLGVTPAMGRGFLAEDDDAGAPRVVLLTHGFWEGRLGPDPPALDRSLILDAHPYRVVGVLPPGFRDPSEIVLPDRAEFFVPIAYSKELLASHGDHEVNVVGRLNAGGIAEDGAGGTRSDLGES